MANRYTLTNEQRQQQVQNLTQQFVSMEERGSTAIAEESTKTAPSGKEIKAVTQTKTAKGKLMDEAPKKSELQVRMQRCWKCWKT